MFSFTKKTFGFSIHDCLKKRRLVLKSGLVSKSPSLLEHFFGFAILYSLYVYLIYPPTLPGTSAFFFVFKIINLSIYYRTKAEKLRLEVEKEQLILQAETLQGKEVSFVAEDGVMGEWEGRGDSAGRRS